MLADTRSRKEQVIHVRIVRLSTFDRTSQGMMNLLGFIMSLVHMQAVHRWLSAYERLVNSQNFFSPYLTQEDMSRIGRNYLETGFYTEVVFRKHNVRFIAIANGVDNDQPETDEFVPFLNIMKNTPHLGKASPLNPQNPWITRLKSHTGFVSARECAVKHFHHSARCP